MQRPVDVKTWLQREPPLDELRAAFPREAEAVQQQIAALLDRNDLDQLTAFAAAVARPGGARRTHNRRGQEAAVSEEVHRQLAVGLLRRLNLSLATGVTSGRVRFNLLNGWMIQRLLFTTGLERKPVSMFWFRLVWPLLWQRRLLMPLVGPEGIYCFYSRRLVESLAELIGGRDCVEIAAGDGTLARFLDAEGVRITATDDYSWTDRVHYSERVVRQDAARALRSRQPSVVICSWPPEGNAFEREVFKTRSVELYIMIGSRHELGAGNWGTYRAQRDFEIVEDEMLSSLVLPPDLDSAVYIFRRRNSGNVLKS